MKANKPDEYPMVSIVIGYHNPAVKDICMENYFPCLDFIIYVKNIGQEFRLLLKAGISK